MIRRLLFQLTTLLVCSSGFAKGSEDVLLVERDGLPNFFGKVDVRRQINVVYLGGSITAAQNGWRDLSLDWMKVRYPESMFSQVNAGIGGTGSDLGAFRTDKDVIAWNPDLVFIEFAVNDGGRPVDKIVRTMEGIVRKIWMSDPETDICFVYTTDEGKFKDYLKGNEVNSVKAMEMVADHYGIPSINFASRLKPVWEEGRMVFSGDPSANKEKIVFTKDSVHPLSESGHPLYASAVAEAFESMGGRKGSYRHELPVAMDAYNWTGAKIVNLSQVNMSGWTIVASGPLYDSYSGKVSSIYQGKAGSTISFRFKGTVLGLYDFLGPESGKLIVTIDGDRKEIIRFDKHCSYDRLANTVIADNLEDKVHDVFIEVSGDRIDKGKILYSEHKEKFKKNPSMFEGLEYRIGGILLVGDLIDEQVCPPFIKERLASFDNDPSHFKTKAPQLVKPAARVYVRQSVEEGNGTIDKPYSSLEKAFEASAGLIASGKLTEGPVEIILLGKRYLVGKTVRLGDKMSGTMRNPIVVRSESMSHPVELTGGVAITEWKVEDDPQMLSLLPESSRGKVLVADLKENGVVGMGDIVFGGFGSKRAHCGTYRFDTMPVPELFYNGKVQTMSRWPDLRDTVISINRFSDPRAEKWDKEDDVWLHGYWKYLYADTYEKFEAFKDGRIVLTPPYNRYGFSDETRGFITESRWYALNLLSEMNMVGEWKISTDKGKIWFFPPKGFDRNRCVLSAYGPAILMDKCSNVTFRDIEIDYVKGDGVVATDCDNLTFYNCNIHDLSGLGIQILGGAGHTLHSLRVDNMGRGGLYVQSGDKTTLSPSNSVVENCWISNLSRIDRTYTPAVLVDGVGIKIQHCKFQYIPSSAIRLEGNDMLIQLNEFADCVLDSNDQGAVDIWFNSFFRGNLIRWNYFHDIGSPDRMAGAVRMDDAISGTYIVENIMRNSSTKIFGAVQIHGGNYNVVNGNLFIDDNHGVSNTLWPDEYWNNHFRNDRIVKLLKQVDLGTAKWRRYKDLEHLYENPNLNFVMNNKFVNCGDVYFKNSSNDKANRIDRVVLLDNKIRNVRNLPRSLKGMNALADPAYRIPVEEIGLY